MSLADHETGPRRCKAADMLANLTGDDQETLARWLSTDWPTAPVVSRAIDAEGYGSVSASQIRSHRRGDCICHHKSSVIG